MLQGLLRFVRFSGTLSRLGFAAHLALWLIAMLALMLAATSIFDLTISDASEHYWDEPLPNALVLILIFWTMMALSAQRIRDMGFSPLPFLILLAAIELLETWVLPRLTEARLPAPLENFTPLGGILSFASLAWLLFWPGGTRSPATDRAPSSARPDPARRNGAAPPPPA